MTKIVSQEFNRNESWILGAISKLDKFLLNSQVRVQSGTVPGTSRDTNKQDQERSKDCSQNDPHPEVDVTVTMSTQFEISDTDAAIYKFLPFEINFLAKQNVQI